MEVGDGRVLVCAVLDLASDGGREILVRGRYLRFREAGDGLEERALAHPGRAADADAERVPRETGADFCAFDKNAAERFRDGAEICGGACEFGVGAFSGFDGDKRVRDFVRAGFPAGEIGVERPKARGACGEDGIELCGDGAHVGLVV